MHRRMFQRTNVQRTIVQRTNVQRTNVQRDECTKGKMKSVEWQSKIQVDTRQGGSVRMTSLGRSDVAERGLHSTHGK